MSGRAVSTTLTMLLLSVGLLAPSNTATSHWAEGSSQKELSDAEARTEGTARFKKVALAFWGYWDDYREFPPPALVSSNGQALLSWRVLLLPYLGEEKLFREFKLEQPWDSPHNKTLLTRMPSAYAPVRGNFAQPGLTSIQAFTGSGTIFEGIKPTRLQDVTDGTSNTIMFVEGAEPVPWTKPADLPFDQKKPLPKLGASVPDVFFFCTVDGAAFVGRRTFNERQMRAAIIRNDGVAGGFDGIVAKD